jgi:hypothetical protein
VTTEGNEGRPPPGVDPEVHQQMVAAFHPLGTLRRRHPILVGIDQHPPDSIVAHDIARAPALGREPWDIALDQISNALDHLLAWRQLYVQGRMYPTFSHITLLRGAMEAATTARWVLDATKTAEERIGRAAGWLVEDYVLRGKSEHFMKIDTSGGSMTAAERIVQLQERAKAVDIPILAAWDHTSRFRGYGVPPGPRSAAHYGVVSAFAHARRWRLLLADTKILRQYDGGRSLRSVGANDTVTVSLTMEAVGWLDFAINDATIYAGLTEPLDVDSAPIEPVAPPPLGGHRGDDDAVDGPADDGPALV